MGIEIERKFLVTGDGWRAGDGARCTQGYLAVGPLVAIRVRLMGGRGTINIKKATADITRDEFEYAIPVEDVEQILAGLCVGHVIDKTRYKIVYDGLTWEVDEFHGANAGLVVAEIELDSPDRVFERPPWLGEEVSHDARYFNSSLTQHPYTEW